MKRILLMPLLLLVFSSSPAIADKTPQYTSPVPTLMRLVVKNKDILELSKKQKASLKQWRRAYLKKAIADIKASRQVESKLHNISITGEPSADVQILIDEAIPLKKQVWENKLACRDVIKDVLNEDQWETLVLLYNQKQSLRPSPKQ